MNHETHVESMIMNKTRIHHLCDIFRKSQGWRVKEGGVEVFCGG